MLSEPDLDLTRLTGDAASGGQVQVHGARRSTNISVRNPRSSIERMPRPRTTALNRKAAQGCYGRNTPKALFGPNLLGDRIGSGRQSQSTVSALSHCIFGSL